jgi:hypothetical protein
MAMEAPTPNRTPMAPPTSEGCDRFDQKLAPNNPAARPDRHANADLTDTFSHGDKHDVHDANAANQQRYAGNRGNQLAVVRTHG